MRTQHAPPTLPLLLLRRLVPRAEREEVLALTSDWNTPHAPQPMDALPPISGCGSVYGVARPLMLDPLPYANEKDLETLMM